MVNFFGNTDALIGSIELFIGAIFVLGSLVFRKSVANDLMGYDFSIIGSNVPGILAFLIANSFIDNIKYPVMIGLVCFFLGGFSLAEIVGDGTASG